MIRILFALLWVSISPLGFAAAPVENEEPEVMQLVAEAVVLVDEKRFSEALPRLEAALLINPKSLVARYELGVAFYAMRRYRKARRHLRKAVRLTDTSPYAFQMLGNSIDRLKHPKGAVRVYQKGLERFPNAGNLYLEMGVLEANYGSWDAALYWWERGMVADPGHPSNYFWAAREMARREQWMWSFLYGETFCNLERNTSRTGQTGALLMQVSERLFQRQQSINGFWEPRVQIAGKERRSGVLLHDEMSPEDLEKKLALIWEVAMTLRFEEDPEWGSRALTIEDSFRMRVFTGKLWEGQDAAHRAIPVALFRWWNTLAKHGHLESYTMWLLAEGRQEEAEMWAEKNQEKVKALYDYMNDNPFVIDTKNSLTRLGETE